MRALFLLMGLLVAGAVCAVAEEPLSPVETDFLEGRIQECLVTSEALLAKDPTDSVAREMRARALTRFGDYARAETVLRTPAAGKNLHIQACLAELHDAQGKADEATALRRAALANLTAIDRYSTRDLVALSNICRHLREFDAANQSLQLAQDREPKNPFVQLEKIRLFRTTHGDTIAALTAKRLAQSLPKCALAYSEWAETLWVMKEDSEAVSMLCHEALRIDPTINQARIRLAYYALIANRVADAQELISENLALNATDRASLYLQRVATQLIALEKAPATGDDSELDLLFSDLYGARGDYAEALQYASAAHAAAPSAETARQAGLAHFRMGDFEKSRTLLEQTLKDDRYDVETGNLLALVESQMKTKPALDGAIEVFANKDEAILSAYTATVAQQAYLRELGRYGVVAPSPLRLHLCTDRDDLQVLTKGIPFGCACDPSDPATTGVVSFDRDVYFWSPEAGIGGYRWDVAVHRAVAQAAVRAATDNRAPQWLREGIAGDAARTAIPDYLPLNLAAVLELLASEPKLTLATMDEGLLGPQRPAYLGYAELLAEDWRDAFGDEKISLLLSAIKKGELWADALQHTFGMALPELDEVSKLRILARYEWFTNAGGTRGQRGLSVDGFNPSVREAADAAAKALTGGDRSTAQEKIAQASALAKMHNVRADDQCAIAQVMMDLGDAQGAAVHAVGALALAPMDMGHLGLYRRVNEALRAMTPVPDIHYTLITRMRRIEPDNADTRFELAKWHQANGRDTEALAECRAALGIRPQWLEAHRFMAQTAMRAKDYTAALPSLVVLHEAQPRHVGMLEELVRCARAMNAENTKTYYATLAELAPASAVLNQAN